MEHEGNSEQAKRKGLFSQLYSLSNEAANGQASPMANTAQLGEIHPKG